MKISGIENRRSFLSYGIAWLKLQEGRVPHSCGFVAWVGSFERSSNHHSTSPIVILSQARRGEAEGPALPLSLLLLCRRH
jgi:hypothetical protein